MKKLLILLILTIQAINTHAYEVKKFHTPAAGSYQVLRIYDGDTFTILVPPKYKVNIRISGIDAPERTQEFGMYARLFLERLINDKPVYIKALSIDKWGRTVARCFNDKGQDLALEMLRNGMAWHYAQYDNTEAYTEAEQYARCIQAGLWCRSNPMTPQDYRNAPRHIRRKN